MVMASIDDQDLSIDEAIERMRCSNYPPGKVVRILAKSPSSPAFREAWGRLRELANCQLEVRAVFTAMRPGNTHFKKVLRDYITHFGLTSARDGIRIGTSPILAKMNEQVQFGTEALWAGDAVDAKRVNESGLTLGKAGPLSADFATECFEIAWEMSNPVAADLALKVAIEIEKQARQIMPRKKPVGKL
jgi:hypothetical protein